jgi:hypothetical protein
MYAENDARSSSSYAWISALKVIWNQWLAIATEAIYADNNGMQPTALTRGG